MAMARQASPTDTSGIVWGPDVRCLRRIRHSGSLGSSSPPPSREPRSRGMPFSSPASVARAVQRTLEKRVFSRQRGRDSHGRGRRVSHGPSRPDGRSASPHPAGSRRATAGHTAVSKDS